MQIYIATITIIDTIINLIASCQFSIIRIYIAILKIQEIAQKIIPTTVYNNLKISNLELELLSF